MAQRLMVVEEEPIQGIRTYRLAVESLNDFFLSPMVLKSLLKYWYIKSFKSIQHLRIMDEEKGNFQRVLALIYTEISL